MSILSLLFGEKKKTANVAKERLSLIIAHERTNKDGPDFLPQMRDELMQVIAKYVKIDQEGVRFNLQKQDNIEMLEVNIALPDQK